MHYELLGGPGGDAVPEYRGTYRLRPTYQEQLPEDAPVNRAFLRYCADDLKFLRAKEAFAAAAEYERIGESFEVVQVARCDSDPGMSPPGHLGFDITIAGWWSVLHWGLHWNGIVALPPPPDGPILKLLEVHFRPMLNTNGLFGCWTDARFFLDVIQALTEKGAVAFESRELTAEMGIYQLVLIEDGTMSSDLGSMELGDT